MPSFIRLSRLVFFYNCLLSNRGNLHNTARPFTNFYKISLYNDLVKLKIKNGDLSKALVSREKTTNKRKPFKKDYDVDDDDDDDDNDDNDDDEDDYNFKGDEVKLYETQAARVDKILKVCFRISRKDIEDMFYQTKVRVNGKILKKKSANANIGDEIDKINGFVNDNSKLLNVDRIEILNIQKEIESQRFKVKVKKSKSLIIQNYKENDEWRG